MSSHNHHIYHNGGPDGGYDRFISSGLGTLGVWLRHAGYYTGFYGKLMNKYDFGDPIVAGWSDWQFITGNGYFDFKINENGTETHYVNQYQTDLLASKVVDFIYRHAPSSNPFFLLVTPHAIHTEGLVGSPSDPLPAPRHDGLFDHAHLLKHPNFNEKDVSDKPHIIADIPPLTSDEIKAVKNLFRKRQETLLAVDDLIESTVNALKTAHEINNTVIIYTSDNGFSFGSTPLAWKASHLRGKQQGAPSHQVAGDAYESN